MVPYANLQICMVTRQYGAPISIMRIPNGYGCSEALFWYNVAMARYGFATLLDSHPVGYEFTPDTIPLHVTHVDSFEVGLSGDELAARLHQTLACQKALGVKASADAFLGINKDIPVTTLELTPEFAELHQTIMDMLESESAVLKNPHFHRELFSPHVSIYGDRRVVVGENVRIKDISIGIKMGEGTDAVHRIIATIGLNG